MPNITKIREKLREIKLNLKDGDIREIPENFFGDSYLVARQIIEEYGFQYLRIYDSETSRMIVFCKPKRQERWDYLNEYLKDIPDDWRCVDIGCGRNPWPRANMIVDVYQEFAGYKYAHQVFERGSITDGLKQFQDKEFAFSTCFHVLEHVSDPEGAAWELSRISKAGLVEVPTPWKDGMLGFHETDHKWIVLPGNKEYQLFFYRINQDIWCKFDDPDARGAIERTFITNTDSNGDRAIIRNYFTRIEKDLNTVVKWQNELKVKVIE